jgi:hypothetical protein
LARDIAEKENFYFISNLINVWYVNENTEDIYTYWNIIKRFDILLSHIREFIPVHKITNWMVEQIIDDYENNDISYKYTLEIIHKIFNNEEILNLYFSLLYDIIRKKEMVSGMKWDRLIDEIINSMTDQNFYKLLERPYYVDTKPILDILIEYLPEELKGLYTDKLVLI